MISILMGTYNGEKYLAEQLDSLFSQTRQDFTLYISDDQSTDTTKKIISRYQQLYPTRIILIEREKNSGGAKYNFINLMITIKDDYVMFCDQDDVWFPNKIEVTMSKMEELEKTYGKSYPLLIHTDLQVVDESLRVINLSFKKAMNANYDKTDLNQLLIQNILTGCTVLYNRSLANLLVESPRYCIMHDWWIGLVASAFGRIDHVNDQTIYYRQHNENEIGAKDVRSFKYKINKLLHPTEVREAISSTYKQAESFLDSYRDILSVNQVELLKEYIKIPTYSKFKRWYTICKLGVLKNGIARKIANFIFI